ncbi:MAG TPA: hypothetical protein VI248_21275 [Kineosporiaceae bacterium]
MNLPRLRLRTDPQTFASWLPARSGRGQPRWVEQVWGDDQRVSPVLPEAVPALVAAALELFRAPPTAVLFALHQVPSARTGCLALDDGVVAAVVGSGPTGEGEPAPWVEVALVPAVRALGEVPRWIPGRPAAGTALDLRVVPGAETGHAPLHRWTTDAAGHWRAAASGPVGNDPVRLAAQVRRALAGVAGCWYEPHRDLREVG